MEVTECYLKSGWVYILLGPLKCYWDISISFYLFFFLFGFLNVKVVQQKFHNLIGWWDGKSEQKYPTHHKNELWLKPIGEAEKWLGKNWVSDPPNRRYLPPTRMWCWIILLWTIDCEFIGNNNEQEYKMYWPMRLGYGLLTVIFW